MNDCDSIIELTLTVKSLEPFVIYDTICSNNAYAKHGFIIPASKLQVAGTFEFQDTIPSTNGCDSIIKLTLTINPLDTTPIVATIAQGEVYSQNGFNESVSGTYTQKLQNQFGCDSTVILELTVTGVGINNYELPITNYVVYPNPTTGKLTINCEDKGACPLVRVYNVVGQVVFTSVVSAPSPETTIDISHLANGMYFLKIDNKVFKIIKN